MVDAVNAFMSALMDDHGLVAAAGRPEPCEGCGTTVIAAKCGDGTRKLLSMEWLQIGPVEGWDPVDEHTAERCRSLRR